MSVTVDIIKTSKIIRENKDQWSLKNDEFMSKEKLFSIITYILNSGGIIIEENHYWSTRDDSNYELNRLKNDLKSFTLDTWGTLPRVMCTVIRCLADNNVCTKFDIFKEIKTDLHCFLKEEHNTPITIRSNIVLQYAMSNTDRKNCKNITFEGSFEIRNKSDSMDLNIPANMKVPPFNVYDFNNDSPTHYESAKEYNMRDSRMNRLNENRKKREAMKQAAETGILSLPDNYGIPLEVGCRVAFYGGGCCRIGKVAGQTTVKVKVAETGRDWYYNCYPYEVVRIQ